jgi:hypothetical protein
MREAAACTDSALGFNVVPDHVARNPVARSIARRRLEGAVRDFALQVYLQADGSMVQQPLMAGAHVLAVAVRLAEMRAQRDEDRNSPALRVMAGGMSAIAQCSSRGWRWRSLDAVAVDTAISAALELLRTATAQETRAAWAHVENLK